MNIQIIIVAAIILGAVIYAGSLLHKRSQSFSLKKGCRDDCGCNGAKE